LAAEQYIVNNPGYNQNVQKSNCVDYIRINPSLIIIIKNIADA